VPYILFPYDSFSPAKLRHSRLKKTIYRLLFDNVLVRQATLIQSANEEERKQVVSYTNRPERVFVAPFGFCIEEFSRKRPEYLFRSLVPWDVERTKTILYLARISVTKGLEILMEAYEKLTCVDDSFRLLVVGPVWDEDYNRRLRARFQALISEKVIHFTDHVSDDTKYSCFQNSYLYVLPSYSENFGITVLEAIANRLIPIVTYSVPWQELVDHSAGYRIANGDVDAIVQSVLTYANLPEQTQDVMKENAFKLASKFDRRAIVEVYSQAIRGVVGNIDYLNRSPLKMPSA